MAPNVGLCLPASTYTNVSTAAFRVKTQNSLGAHKNHNIWINMKILMGLNAAARDMRVPLIWLFVLFLKIPLALLRSC